MPYSKSSMPQDANGASIPALCPKASKSVSVDAGTLADAIDVSDYVAILMLTDADVYYALGDADVSASANSLERLSAHNHFIALGNNSHIRFFGGTEATTVKIECA